MRLIKILAIFGLVLAVSGTAWADPVLPNGPVVLQITSLDAGTVYGAAAGTYGGTSGNPMPAGVPGLFAGINGAPPSEDSWGIFTVNTINVGAVLVPGASILQTGPQVWSTATPGNVLVGIFWGEVDNALNVAAGGVTTAYGTGLNIAIWEQAPGFTLAGALPSGRVGASPWDYTGIGGAGSTLWFTGVSSPGFYTGVGLDPTAEFDSQFTPTAPGDIAGSAHSWIDAAPITGLGTGSINSRVDTNFFLGAGGENADVRLQITTTSLDPTNTTNFTVSDSDPVTAFAVPEPLTMFGVVMGLGSVGTYIRRRMKVTAA